MATPKEIVEHYVSELLDGGAGDAFRGLIDLDPEIIHELINTYESTEDPDVQVLVIKTVSELRKEPALCFLRHALRRDDERIWKSALEGLAMAESVESVDAMDHVLASVTDEAKKAWIQEAMSDTNAVIENKRNE